MKTLAPSILILSLCIVGCSPGTGNNATGAGGAPAANASGNGAAAAAAAPAAAIAAPAGPCPFEIRNVRAVRSGLPHSEPGSGAAIYVSLRPDAQGRQPQMSQRMSPPPDLLLDIDPDPGASANADREWAESGIGGFPATGDYTHAVVRCRGNRVARVPIEP
jgi:hypothetical protein